MVKLSILIPVYNAEKHIGKLLDCILEQMLDGIEVILLNDGSQDSSEMICAEYATRHSKQIRLISRENQGVVYTRRELFNASKGEWIWIIDADDVISDNSLAVIMDTISKYVSHDMVMFDYFYADGENRTIVHQLPFKDNDFFSGDRKNLVYKELVSGHILNSLWSKVFKRECIDFMSDYSEYRNVNKANDLLQLLPIVTNAKSILYKRIPLYTYYYNVSGNLTHVFQDSTYISLSRVWMRLKEYIVKWNMWNGLQDMFYQQAANRVVELLKYYVWSGHTCQKYFALLEKVMNDDVFSDALQHCDCSCFKWKDGLFVRLIRCNAKHTSFTLLAIQQRIRRG